MTVKTLKANRCKSGLDRMHAHCLTDNKVKVKRNNFAKNETGENIITIAI